MLRRLLVVLVVIFTLLAILYVYRSRDNPYVCEIIIGSIVFSLLVGILSSVVQNFFDSWVKSHPVMSSSFVVCLLLMLLALIIHLSNVTEVIKGKIPVTYLIHKQTKEMPSMLSLNSEDAFHCSMEALLIFNKFQEQNKENAELVKNLVDYPYPTNSPISISEFRLFRDLTEHLVAYYLFNMFTTSELEEFHIVGESQYWLAIPHDSIRGERKQLEYIKGDLKNNPFYGIRGVSIKPIGMSLPKGTKITLKRDNGKYSSYVIKNKYLEVEIKMGYMVHSSGSIAYLNDSAFSPTSDAELQQKRKGPYARSDVVISYNARFSKLRHAFPEMKYHKMWADSLLYVLQRKFAWGSPELVDMDEIFREYYKKNPNPSTTSTE